MQTIHIFSDDVSPSQTWMLLEWCWGNGASEFTLERMGFADSASPLCDEFEAVLGSYRLSDAAREHLTAPTREEVIRLTQLWRLCAESMSLLKTYLKDGLFTSPTYSDEGWFEDPAFYRSGNLILGIVSHEMEGVALVTPDEASQIASLGIQSRPRAEWI